ncbi:MAG: hypothetical protein VB039_01160 [Oscillospiraceae bacterium]|nr:hypothetical protein [Oscillospiraceae bacterium]
MNEQNNGSQRRKNNGGALGWALAALIIFVLNAAKGLGGAVSRAAVGAVLALAAVGVFAGAVALAVKKSKSAGVTQAKGASAMKKLAEKPEFAWLERRETAAEVSTAQRPQIRVYDDEAAANNFARDRQRRIEQLDSFLQNGIIDREEYKILRGRFEKDI